MGLFSSALGGFGLDMLGSGAQTAMSYDANRRLQQKSMDWEKEKLQNSVQWHMQDLEKAGLNPILAASQGAIGGSTSASVSGGNYSAGLDRYENANTAKKAQKSLEELQNAQVDKAKAEAEAAGIATAKEAAELEANRGRYEAEKAFNNSKVGRWLNMIGMGGRSVQPVVNAIGTAMGGAMVGRGIKTLRTINSAPKALQVDQAMKEAGRKMGQRMMNPGKEEWIRQPTATGGFMEY